MARAAFAAALIIVVLPRTVEGMSRVYSSLDWLCESMPHIAVVEVRLAGSADGPAEVRSISRARADTRQVLKGLPPDSTRIDCSSGVRLKPGGRASFLAFFDHAFQVEYAIALDDSESCPGWDAITPDFRVLRRRQEIMAAVSSRLDRMKRDTLRTRRDALLFWVPPGTRAGKQLSSGSQHLLKVPPDPKYLPALLRSLQSPSWQERKVSAQLLANYPGPETEAALRTLLTDSAVDTTAHLGPLSGPRWNDPYYPVRQTAYFTLRELGVTVDPPEGFLDETSSGDRSFLVFPSNVEHPSRPVSAGRRR